MIRPPCQGCLDRTVTPNCHMGCKRYQAYATEREQIRLARARDRGVTDILIHNTMAKANKVRK